jgi:hypothetical protein
MPAMRISRRLLDPFTPSTPIVSSRTNSRLPPVKARAIVQRDRRRQSTGRRLRLTLLEGGNGDRQVMAAHCNQAEIDLLKPSKLETFAPLNLCGLFAIRAADLSRGRWAAPGRSDP